MATKKPVKKAATAKTSAEPKETKEQLRKEEIKEIVEETLETLLEENPEEKIQTEQKEEEKPTMPDAAMSSEPVVSEKSSESSSESSESTEAVTSATPEVTTPEVSAPTITSPDVTTPESTPSEDKTSETQEAVEQPSSEEKTDTTGSESIPPAPGVTAPVSPTVEPISPESTEQVQPAKKSPLFAILFLIIIFGAALGGLWYATVHNMIPVNVLRLAGITKPVPTSAVHVLPTATPTPAQIDLSQNTIAVLNGSGVPGAAAKVKGTLTDAGFTVSSTGNASSSDTTETVIAAKAAVSKDFLDKLTKTLGETYIVSSTVESLPSSAATDVEVTIGSTTAH